MYGDAEGDCFEVGEREEDAREEVDFMTACSLRECNKLLRLLSVLDSQREHSI